ncbi:hypothetical protein V8E36_006278, partial [Tilletia maclaganii]
WTILIPSFIIGMDLHHSFHKADRLGASNRLQILGSDSPLAFLADRRKRSVEILRRGHFGWTIFSAGGMIALLEALKGNNPLRLFGL